MVEYELQAWEPQLPKEEAHGTPNDSPLRHQEKEEDNVQRSPAQCPQDTDDDDTTQSSALGSSAHEPISPKKQSFVRRFWSEQISVVVDFDSCRDHLALERTFLAYLRTGVATAILGTIVAQLFALQQADSGFGYAILGKPLATVCYGLSICATLLGACRAWRLQKAMLRGKAIAGGFEVTSLAVGLLALVLIFFGLLIALDIVKESTT
ncbi:hypothetical protein CGCF415_v001770 [Colletotrichum fructicola]|nr:uncharacterized protein CGMCC3_g6747 [Colletotrichum fructicola]KAE9577273.1 hypothetical protein CGMCC3_g6747 [Colletotrichum fructicola]KAF4422983.1 hypothetical protein CFRS1_v001016 [Colletotrichum fructicola]KAF4892046.1 hypothetical protein CGCFRS4_v007817 [Colletotrichum fructicola]KAF4914983.1 hypothetical protein CGCF415_v001770 [Colletotrichum fructicola]KAF4935787.1 hypothetical protein CGCF245_v007328 [Colletotrichum fructicola]